MSRLYGPVERKPRNEYGTLHLVRFLGIDYGRRRIGLALSDPSGLLSRPWKTLASHGNRHAVAKMIGAEITQLLAEALRLSVSIPIVLQDERLSSREAESLLARRIKNWRDRKPLLDAASAAVILQDYLDGRVPMSDRVAGPEDLES